MIHHTCESCQRGFVATSLGEAQEEFERIKVEERAGEHSSGDDDFEVAVDDNTVAYAQYCPYCGGQGVTAI